MNNDEHNMLRRSFLALAAAAQARAAQSGGSVVIDPRPRFPISPWLYMQFMEPLGVTDSSVEAAWDYDIDDWRADFVSVVKDLAPGSLRFGGIFSRYYKWREGIGPAARRPWMRNYAWGGKETNRVGTNEFVDLARRVGAEPFFCVNFLGDGVARYRKTPEGDRTGDAREAADWVSYAQPLGVKLWQIGNETSYGSEVFTRDEAIARTIEFARAMKARDKSIRLIGWGDRQRPGNGPLWAGEMARRAGEYLDMVAIHLMGQSPTRPDTVLRGMRYAARPEQAWEELLALAGNVEARVTELEQALDAVDSRAGIAVTEGHLSLRPHNANPILCQWLSAPYHARSLNIYQRHGARVKIATAADFEGTRWTVNAVMLPVPRGTPYLTPAGSIMRLFARHNGREGIAVKAAPAGLDVAAARTGNRVWLHVANLEYNRAVEASFAVQGMAVTGGRVFSIAPRDFADNVSPEQRDVFRPRETALPAASPTSPEVRWRFAPGSVSAVELVMQ